MLVEGVDLDDDDQIEALARSAPDVMWASVDGETYATGYLSDAETVGVVAVVSRVVESLHEAVPAAHAVQVAEDFVAVSDIAERLPFSRQYILMLVKGERGPGDFPRHRGVVGKDRRIWDWQSVNAWFAAHFGLGDGYRHLTPFEVTDVNRMLGGGRAAASPLEVKLGEPQEVDAPTRVGQSTRATLTARPPARGRVATAATS